MRASTVLVGAVLALTLSAPASMATPSPPAAPVSGSASSDPGYGASEEPTAPSLSIDRRTSPMWLHNAGDDETGPWYLATGVTVRVENCPADGYLIWASLTQGRTEAQWTSGSAKGAQERFCEAPSSVTSVGFFAPRLRPGWARAHVWITPWWDSETVLAESSRRVWIPWRFQAPTG